MLHDMRVVKRNSTRHIRYTCRCTQLIVGQVFIVAHASNMSDRHHTRKEGTISKDTVEGPSTAV